MPRPPRAALVVAALAVAAGAVALALAAPRVGSSPGGGEAAGRPAHAATAAAPASAPARTAPAPQAPRAAAPTPAERRMARLRSLEDRIDWRRSTALGTPNAGRLVEGVQLPPEGVHFFTWDPVRWTRPNPPERRHGTARLLRTIMKVAREHRAANPGAPRVAVGDIALPGGGSFDARHGVLGEFGGPGTLGHVSHQNGLDVDIYYPRRDRRERGPDRLADIDPRLSQDLVDRFVAAGAQFVFVGPRTGLGGPGHVVQPLVRHDDHIHVRLPPA